MNLPLCVRRVNGFLFLAAGTALLKAVQRLQALYVHEVDPPPPGWRPGELQDPITHETLAAWRAAHPDQAG